MGIVLLEGKIIYVYGKVCIDKLDYYGIFSKDKGGYIYWFCIIKCLIEFIKVNF